MLLPMGVRCLIVDDNAEFLEAAADLLQRQGISVVGVASSVGEALRKASELRPDVTLVDIDLGDESGFDLAQRLAANVALDPSYVILTSAYDEIDYTELIVSSPAIGFLPKTELSGRAISEVLDGARRG